MAHVAEATTKRGFLGLRGTYTTLHIEILSRDVPEAKDFAEKFFGRSDKHSAYRFDVVADDLVSSHVLVSIPAKSPCLLNAFCNDLQGHLNVSFSGDASPEAAGHTVTSAPLAET